MSSEQASDDNHWRLSRIRQLWAELRTTRARTSHYAELVECIRREAEAYNRGASGQAFPRRRKGAGPAAVGRDFATPVSAADRRDGTISDEQTAS